MRAPHFLEIVAVDSRRYWCAEPWGFTFSSVGWGEWGPTIEQIMERTGRVVLGDILPSPPLVLDNRWWSETYGHWVPTWRMTETENMA